MEDIQLLPAGYATLDLKAKPTLRRIQYWDFNFREPVEVISDNEYREAIVYSSSRKSPTCYGRELSIISVVVWILGRLLLLPLNLFLIKNLHVWL